MTPPLFWSVPGRRASLGQTFVQALQSTQISEIEAFFFFPGTRDTAPTGHASSHNPHPIQVSQSTIMFEPSPKDPVIPAKAGIQDFKERMSEKQYCVYILASQRNGTLYDGVTSDLIKRVYEHKNDLAPGFTEKYSIHRLVYFETMDDIESAIKREKQIKKWNRDWKIELIEKNNPDWRDLYFDLI